MWITGLLLLMVFVTTIYSDQSPPQCITEPCKCGLKKGTGIACGNEAAPNEYPWQALITFTDTSNVPCGGSLIAPKYILTAAQCVVNKTINTIQLFLGEHDTTTPDPITQEFTVGKIILHKDYDQGLDYNNDIALLKLRKSVTYTNEIQPVCLPFGLETKDLSNLTGTITGWTETSGSELPSNVLLEIDITFITSQTCKSSTYEWGRYVTNDMICGAERNTKHGCGGDGGGPFVWKGVKGHHYLMGIGSFSGNNCTDPKYPPVFTKVTKYLDWIKVKTGLDKEFCRPTE